MPLVIGNARAAGLGCNCITISDAGYAYDWGRVIYETPENAPHQQRKCLGKPPHLCDLDRGDRCASLTTRMARDPDISVMNEIVAGSDNAPPSDNALFLESGIEGPPAGTDTPMLRR